ncbi:Metallo-dependent phosphatase [Coniochaeta sp. PMI_546]|nr:Metallo-dependent phosphatase [Coniochaeta sp. PMI_546]
MTTLPVTTSSPRGTRTSRTRKTRFVCISDTHNCTVKLPKGDVLIHAGDLTNQGSYSELCKAIQWLEKADFEVKIVIAGNHDVTLDAPFYSANSDTFHNQSPQSLSQCLSLVTSSPSITYLSHAPATIRLCSPTGPRTTFTVFGSPYSPCQEQGVWAFQYGRDSDQAEALWGAVPLDTDILVTHTPPYRHCDEAVSRRKAMGCEMLRRAMWRVRPRLHVCGHVHEGRGVERVMWDLDRGGNVQYKEGGVEGWTDEGVGGKMSLVDLTGRRGRRLENDGGHRHEAIAGSGGLEAAEDGADGSMVEDEKVEDGFRSDPCCGLYLPRTAAEGPEPAVGSHTPTMGDPPAVFLCTGTLGLGQSLTTNRSPVRSDTEALMGRMGRRETCVINCAVTATNWPHTGGRRFNKPIVVDLDLPVLA